MVGWIVDFIDKSIPVLSFLFGWCQFVEEVLQRALVNGLSVFVGTLEFLEDTSHAVLDMVCRVPSRPRCVPMSTPISGILLRFLQDEWCSAKPVEEVLCRPLIQG